MQAIKNKLFIFNRLSYKACETCASSVHIMCNKSGKTPLKATFLAINKIKGLSILNAQPQFDLIARNQAGFLSN
jgi:hypothetical protein